MRAVSVSLLIAVGLAMLAPQAQANNPLRRFCVIYGGSFEVYPDGANDVALCRWGGVAIDALSLVTIREENQSLAASAVLSNRAVVSCAGAAAQREIFVRIDGSTGPRNTLCVFSDGSALTLATLLAPWPSERADLKNALISR